MPVNKIQLPGSSWKTAVQRFCKAKKGSCDEESGSSRFSYLLWFVSLKIFIPWFWQIVFFKLIIFGVYHDKSPLKPAFGRIYVFNFSKHQTSKIHVMVPVGDERMWHAVTPKNDNIRLAFSFQSTEGHPKNQKKILITFPITCYCWCFRDLAI